MNKTIVVKSERMVKHPQYGKYVRRYTTYHAHDERNEAREGDIVELASTRPLSKLKRWRLVRVVTTADLPGSGGEE
jgi:small subunit ribosomal protein S17